VIAESALIFLIRQADEWPVGGQGGEARPRPHERSTVLLGEQAIQSLGEMVEMFRAQAGDEFERVRRTRQRAAAREICDLRREPWKIRMVQEVKIMHVDAVAQGAAETAHFFAHGRQVPRADEPDFWHRSWDGSFHRRAANSRFRWAVST
jgi:hypothetical protein